MEEQGNRPKRDSGRITYLSRIRVLASMAIVILHTFTMFAIVQKDTMTKTESYVTRMVPFLMMWAVPCFVMVSGVLLLDERRDISISKLLKKYVLRIVLVLLLFTAVFYFLDLWMGNEDFAFADLKTIPKEFLLDQSWAHLWYLYMLIGIYLLLPAFRLVARYATDSALIYLGVVLILFLSILPMLEKFTGEDIGFVIAVSSIFPVYLFGGYMIHNGKLRIGPILGGGLVFIGVAGILLLTSIDFGEKQNVVDKLLGNYAFLPVILLSAGMFVILRGDGERGKEEVCETGREKACERTEQRSKTEKTMKRSGSRIWEFLDRYSFGIYLTHLIFLRFLIRVVKWNPFEYGSFWMLIPTALFAYGAALLTSMLLKCIPGLKRLI